jgi:tetratricopeptide (TPR) repeat protein
LNFAEKALDRFPDDPELLVAAAALMLQMGRPQEGEKLVESAMRKKVNDPELLGVMAELKWSQGELTDAQYLFERALSYAPESSRLHYLLSRLLFARGDARALQHAKRAVELDGACTDYRRLYAAMLEQSGRSEDAYEQLREARSRSPGDARLLLRLSDTMTRNGRTSQALEYLEMAAAIDPENPLYWRELGEVYDVLGATSEGEEARSRANRLEKAFEAYAEAVGLVSQGDEEKARSILESEVRANPEFTTGAVLLADLYRKVGENEKALSLYEDLLKRNPSRARAREETAWIYVDKGELEKALEMLRDTSPEEANRALLEGYQRMVEADWEGAMVEFKRAQMRYPLNPRILQQISLCLHSLGRPKEALAYLEKAHNIEPENAEIDSTARLVRFEYGLDLEKQGEWKKALDIFSGLKQEDPEEAEYLFHEAYCLQNLWEYSQAIEIYKKGIRLDPKSAWVRINLATCLYAVSRYDEAAEQWELLVAASQNPEYIYNLGLARIRQWRLKEGWKLVGQAAEAGFRPAQVLRETWQK